MGESSVVMSNGPSYAWAFTGLLCLACAGIMLTSSLTPVRDTDVVLYESGAAPIGASGNNYDDGDQDSSNYAYDLRPMMRLAKTLEDDWFHKDALVSGVSYYLNICANTMVVPNACKKLAKQDPAPAYQIGSNGNCYYLGT